MIISNLEQANLVSAIHEGILETPLWAGFLAQLCESCLADCTMLLLQRGDGDIEVARCTDGNIAQEAIPAFHRKEIIPFAVLRPERVYALGEFEVGQQADAGVRQIIPAQYQAARFIHLRSDEGLRAWIIMARRRGDFASSQAALLSGAAAHFKIAMRLHRQIEQERARRQIMTPAAENLGFGWLALGSNGKIIGGDTQAEQILADTQILRRARGGRLIALSADVQGQLAEQITLAAQDGNTPPLSLRLGDDPLLDMLLVAPSRKQQKAFPGALLLVYLLGDRRDGAGRAQQLQQLFALAPKEARLALALSRGRSIAQSAADQGISIHTARLYSKRIYAKTGSKGQADLVRLILSSQMALT